jgi:hypothetical protein
MRSRRSAITLLVVMILVVGALSAAERDRTSDKTATTTAADALPPQTTGHDVIATLPKDSPVRAKVGDSVLLRVRSETPDIAQILQLGIQAPVGPALPGALQFVAEAPGTFPVTLEVAGTTGGVVQVR